MSSPQRAKTSAITISNAKLFPTREKKAVGAVTCTPVPPSFPLLFPRAKRHLRRTSRSAMSTGGRDEGTSRPPRRCLARFRLTPTFRERRVNFIRRFYRDRVIYDRHGKTEDPTSETSLPSVYAYIYIYVCEAFSRFLGWLVSWSYGAAYRVIYRHYTYERFRGMGRIRGDDAMEYGREGLWG